MSPLRLSARRSALPVLLPALVVVAALTAGACRRSTPPASAPTPVTPPPAVASAAPTTVLLISIDGLLPEYYLEATTRFRAPNLARLLAAGSHAAACESIFPSVTYPAHASIVTGVRSALHGIVANSVFAGAGATRRTYRPGDWYWYADELRVPALWNAVRARGLTSGAVSWPGTVGASIDYLIPEVWPARRTLTHESLLEMAATPEVLAAVRREGPLPVAALGEPDRDDWIARTAAGILQRHRPSLLLVHLISVDHATHVHGPGAPEVAAALTRVDAALGVLLDAVAASGGFARTTVLVTGDHGGVAVHSAVAPNTLFRAAGLIETSDVWKVWAHSSGSQAGIYLRDPADRETAAAALRLLEENAVAGGTRRYTVLSRAELDGLGSHPGALCAVDGAPGYTISSGLRGELVRATPLRGNHGSRPHLDGLATGLVLAGRGIKPGVLLPSARLIDIAPTVAHLLDLAMPGVEGRVLAEVLAE
ncbi:MAG: alkaline phosphatase family protein [Planctomycetes bacterium]|nr:alkaline phosphatase family protein [Planctomycetota bacterium]